MILNDSLYEESMKKIILILLLIIRFDLSAQNSKILKTVFNLNLEFKMNLNSFFNIYKVRFGIWDRRMFRGRLV